MKQILTISKSNIFTFAPFILVICLVMTQFFVIYYYLGKSSYVTDKLISSIEGQRAIELAKNDLKLINNGFEKGQTLNMSGDMSIYFDDLLENIMIIKDVCNKMNIKKECDIDFLTIVDEFRANVLDKDSVNKITNFTQNLLSKVDTELSKDALKLTKNAKHIYSIPFFVNLFFAIIIIVVSLILAWFLTEEMLKRERVKLFLEQILKSMPSCMIAMDNNLNVTTYNYVAEGYSNIDFNNLVKDKKSFSDIFPKLQFLEKYIYECFDTREVVYKKEIKINKINEKDLICSLSIYPVINKENELNGLVLRLDDITDEICIRELLLESDKMLTASSTIQEVVKNIKNPISVILLNSSNLDRRLSLPGLHKIKMDKKEINADNVYEILKARKINDFISNINTSGKKIEYIVQNSLKYLSHNSNTIIDHKVIHDLIENVIEILTVDSDILHVIHEVEKNIKINGEEKTKEMYNIVDFEQIFFHVIKNSIESMEQADKKVVNILVNLLHDKVTFKIEDTGVGIENKYLDRVFSSSYTTKDNKKFGVGLSVVKKIVEKNNGTVKVSSVMGHGTTVDIEISYKNN